MNQPKKYNKWLGFINIPIQMGVIIFGFSYFGIWLDENHPNSIFFYNKVLVLVGVAIALANVFRQVSTINKNE